MKETFTLHLEESIMFTTIFSLALRKAGTKTKLASFLLIMTIVGVRLHFSYRWYVMGDWRVCCNKR